MTSFVPLNGGGLPSVLVSEKRPVVVAGRHYHPSYSTTHSLGELSWTLLLKLW